MAAGRIVVPPYFPARDRDFNLLAGALLYVYENETTAKAAIYTNEGLTVLSSNPVVANSSGQFPAIFAEAGTEAEPVLYSIAVTTSTGASPGNPFVFDNYRPSVDWETAASALAEAAAEAAVAAADSAEADAVQTAADLAAIEAIIADAPDAPSVLNKLNRDGDNASAGLLANIGEQYPNLSAMSAPIVDSDVLAGYRSGLKRFTASAFADYIKAFFSASGGSALLGFLQSGTGAVARTAQAKMRDVFNVRDFGAVGDGVANDTAAIQAALTALETGAEALTGGVLYFPRGTYLTTAPLVIDAGNVAGLASVTIRGDGMQNTTIKADPGFGGAAVVRLIDPTYCTLEDVGVDANSVGIPGIQTPNGGSHLTLRRVFTQRCTNGFDMTDMFMTVLEECRAKTCSVGFLFPGFHTSMTVNSCYALDCTFFGYVIQGMTYSTFANCGSDSHGFNGYLVTNAFGVTFLACGAEACGRAAWGFEASSANDAGKPIPGIRVVMDNCFDTGCDASLGGYGGAIYSLQSGGSTIDVEVRRHNEFTSASALSVVTSGGTDHLVRIDPADSVFAGALSGPGLRFPTAIGATSARPALVANDVGYLYLDTTLDADGKPIWWSGTAWVDATGAVV